MNSTTHLALEVQQLRDELSRHEELLANKQLRIQQLEEMLRSFTHRQFGASSEKNPDQHHLFNEAETDTELEAETASSCDTDELVTIPLHQRKKQKRVSIPDWIEREEIIHDLTDAEKICPHDGATLNCIGEESHEQLDIIPAQIKALRHIRKKYACPCCDGYLITASKPKQPIEKSIASPGLLAHIILSKYADALPLYRQIDIFKRLGIELDRTSLANWMIRCGELLQPLINLLHDQLMVQSVIHMDETPVQVLGEPGKTAQSQSYMWVMASASISSPAILFHYSPNRSQTTPTHLLDEYQGAIMVDGYEGYRPVCDAQSLTRLGCWAHARRKFVEAQRAQPKNKQGRADYALAQIQKLYAIEKQIKDEPPDKRYEVRHSRAKPIVDHLKQWLEKSLLHVAPKTAIGKALVY